MEHLYRVIYKHNVIYEGTDGEGARLIAHLLEDKSQLEIKRAELVWWPIPPEEFESGST